MREYARIVIGHICNAGYADYNRTLEHARRLGYTMLNTNILQKCSSVLAIRQISQRTRAKLDSVRNYIVLRARQRARPKCASALSKLTKREFTTATATTHAREVRMRAREYVWFSHMFAVQCAACTRWFGEPFAHVLAHTHSNRRGNEWRGGAEERRGHA